jgi:hypothetical protein
MDRSEMTAFFFSSFLRFIPAFTAGLIANRHAWNFA